MNKKALLFIIFCLFCQVNTGMYAQPLVAKAVLVPHKKLKANNENRPLFVAQQLTAHCKTDHEKTEAFFNWITENISYKVRTYSRYKPSVYEEDDDDEPLQPLNEIVARDVLKKRTAVCDGYARLFKRLCDYANIRCEVITGYARTGNSSYFRSNHKWNAVYFDSAWHLLDATWASGSLNSSGTEFIKSYNGYYFLTSPKDFIHDHYPDDLRWTLLQNAPVLSEFNRSPYTSSAFNKYFISSYSPLKGVIDAAVGDSIIISLDMKTAKPKMFIADNPFIDSTTLFIQSNFGALQALGKVSGNTVRCLYKITSPATEWLQVIYNDEVIMRYRLNIKKDVALK